jgi:hypothetical protein
VRHPDTVVAQAVNSACGLPGLQLTDAGLSGQGRRLGLFAGAAHSYVYHDNPAERAGEIAAAEQEAKTAGRGLWGPPRFGETASVPR